ncbi:hypothetical protein AN189_12960 [Loktanella sp. 3ANDIMAR09]|nr:hypothetical protein AN189_12960 [Loktanella sp. 3ANDIMAR09]
MRQLKDECIRTSIQEAADRLGFGRTTVSLVVHGKYPAPTTNVENRVIEIFGGLVPCPHLKRSITADECKRASIGAMPTNSSDRLRHWTACQTCPLNPAKVKELTQ